MDIFKTLFSLFLLCSICSIWYIVYKVNIIEDLLRDLKFRQTSDHNFIIQKIRNLEFVALDKLIAINNNDKDIVTWDPGKVTCEVNGNAFNVVKKEVE